MRLLLRLGLILILAVAAVVGGILFYVDEIASTAIEEGGTRALGVPTSIGGVRLSLTEGSLGLTALEVSNPPGFGDAPFFRMQDGRVAVTLRSMLEKVIEIPEVTLRDVEVHLESRDGRNNYDVLLSGAEEAASAGDPPAPTEAGPELVVRELRIENVTAYVDVTLLGRGVAKPLVVNVPEIVLRNVGSESGGVTLEALSGIVVSAVLKSLSAPGLGLPRNVSRGLEAGARVLSLPPDERQREVKREAGEEGARQASKYVGKELGEEAGAAAGAAVRSLLGGKRKADESDETDAD